MPIVRSLGTLVVICILFTAFGAADAGGRNLDGRMAPELSFTQGLNGIDSGSTLSSFRGRPVYVKFWLRDCPVCRRELPEVQRLNDRWGKAGLQVLTVVHKYPGAEVQPVMRQLGYDFPVGCDLDGSQAKKFGVTSRPATYLIGVDGRVKSSNGAPSALIAKELGHYRLKQLGSAAGVDGLRDAVWQGRMGTALALAETAAAKPDASAEVKSAADRTKAIADETMRARADWANREARRGRVQEATTEYAALKKAFAKTSLAAEAARLDAAYRRRIGG